MDKLVIASFFKKDKVILIYKSAFILIMLLGFILLKINNTYGNFALPFAFSLLSQGINAHFLAISFFILNICVDFGVNGLIFGFLATGAIIAYEILKGHKLFKYKHILVWTMLVLLNIGYVLIFYTSLYSLFYLIISSILALIFFYITNIFFTAVKNRGFYKKINLDEKLCGAIVLIAFFIGFCNMHMFGLKLVTGLSIFLILIATYIFEAGFCITFGVLIGLSLAIYYINPVYIALYVVLSIVALAFNSKYKILSVIGVIVTHTLFSTYFIDYYAFNIYEFISILISGAIFQFTPLIVFESIIEVFCKRDSKLILIDVVNRTKNSISHRLKDISLVFDRMDTV
ncbi:MAG: hypothetical protein J6V40_00295, partial [Clostridia bacterium]|nr:hypothetical protein [Clostridia bacterium]